MRTAGERFGVSAAFDNHHDLANSPDVDVVVVTVNYRLGPFGWFRQGAIRMDAGSDVERSGNFGTLDLVRALEVPVVCQFIKPKYSNQTAEVMEIFFSHEPDIRGQHILLVEGLVHSGVTSEFLMNDLRARGAASVKLVTLLDRQSARRVALQPDYFGFLVDDTFLVGYGLGAVQQTNRNIPYLAASPVPQMT